MKTIRGLVAAGLALTSLVVVGWSSPVRAATATTVSISASPSPAVVGQAVTLTATASAPGTVTFSYNGQVVGTGTTVGAGVATPVAQRWNYTGNSVPLASAVDSSGNVYVTSYNPSDCAGGRCISRQLTPAGAVNYFPEDAWTGLNYFTTGIAVASNGVIYEAVLNRNAVYKRTSRSVSSSSFVSSSSGLNNPCGLTLDANDNLYISNRYNPNAGVANDGLGSILKVTPAGVVSTYVSGLTNPCGMVMNKTTGVLYYTDNSGDIYSVPAGGGSSSRLVDATCMSAWWGSSQLAIDEAGYLYGINCNGQTVTQISPTGSMWTYYSSASCYSSGLDPLPNGCGGGAPISYHNGSIFLSSAQMVTSSTYKFGVSGYVATLTHTPTQPGSFATGAALAPNDSVTYSSSTGAGTLAVKPSAPQAPDLASASDLGTSTTDNLTGDNTPLIEVPGTYTTGDTITVTATKAGSANVTCTYVIPATGCSLGTLADGTWTISATDTHPTGGASSASSTLSIVVDTSAPSVPTSVDLATASDTGTSTTDNNTSDTTPTLSASGGSAGDTMTLTATKGSTTVTCSYVIGSATNCTMAALSDGTWSVTATLTDAAGNTTSASSPLSMVIDSTGPGALTPDLLAASDSGASSTDDITSDNTPTISLPGQATGDVVTITASKPGASNVTCSYTVGASTSCTLGTLADGTWSVSAAVTDLAGNTGTSLALPVSVDTTAPSAPATADLASSSDTGSSNTDNVTTDSTPTMSATPAGAVNGETVTITAVKSGAASVTCSYVLPATSCDLGTLVDGTWSVSATHTDLAGNTSAASSALSLSIDTSAPSAPSAPDLVTASDLGASSTDNSTSDNTPAMSAGAVPDGSTVTMTASKPGSANVTCTYVKSSSVTSCDLSTLADGTWNVAATVADPAGNASAAGPALALAIDATAPNAPSLPDLAAASDSGASSTDNVTSDSTPNVSAAGALVGETVTLTASKAGAASVSCAYIVGAASSCDLGALADGTWAVSATITDTAGNVSPASPALSLTIDTSPQAAPTSAPDLLAASDTGSSATDNVTNDNTPSMSGGAGAADGDTVTITGSRAGGGVVSCTYVKSPTVSSCDLPALSDGTWNVSATVTDPAGNVSAAGPGLDISVDTTPPAAPTSAPDLLAASDTGSSSTDNVTNDNTASISGGTVANGDTVTITGRRTDGTTVSCTYVASPTVSSCDLPALSDGTWNVSATVTDPAGNVSAAGPGLDISVDTTPPAAPTSAPDLLAASDTGSSSTDNVTNDNTPEISIPGASAGDMVTVVATSPMGTVVICTYIASATSGSCSLGKLADGTWSIIGTVTDPAGNTSAVSPSLALSIDSTPPAPLAPDLMPASDNGPSNTDNLTNDTTPAFGMPNAVAGDSVTITGKKADGTTVSCTYTASSSVTSCNLPEMSDGTWTIDATVTDAAGNKSATSPSMAMVLDTVPPAPPAPPVPPVNPSGQTGDPTPTIVIPEAGTGDTGTATATKGDKTVRCAFVGAPGVRSCDLPALTPGQWFITSTVTDPAGNVSPPSVAIEIEIVKVGLPEETATSGQVALSGSRTSPMASTSIKASELGKVANVVFVVRNSDGSIARTVRVAASTTSTKVATSLKPLAQGQRVEAYTENWLGVSRRAPSGTNVVRARTVNALDKSGQPKLLGASLNVSRIIFDPASPLLDELDKSLLDRVANQLVGKGGLVLISGFARQNQVDTKTFLSDLSVDRALAVSKYLSARGVRAWIRYEGYGAVTKMIGTWEDRKVEIRWVSGASELPGK